MSFCVQNILSEYQILYGIRNVGWIVFQKAAELYNKVNMGSTFKEGQVTHRRYNWQIILALNRNMHANISLKYKFSVLLH